MAKAKTYTIVKQHNGREYETTGTLDELKEHFGYTLSFSRHNPKTIKSLMSALDAAVEARQGSCYNRDSYHLVAEA